MNYYSQKDAIRIARQLSRETGQRHIVRPFALGNKVAYQVVNVDRFKESE